VCVYVCVCVCVGARCSLTSLPRGRCRLTPICLAIGCSRVRSPNSRWRWRSCAPVSRSLCPPFPVPVPAARHSANPSPANILEGLNRLLGAFDRFTAIREKATTTAAQNKNRIQMISQTLARIAHEANVGMSDSISHARAYFSSESLKLYITSKFPKAFMSPGGGGDRGAESSNLPSPTQPALLF